jgi:predicted dienelactone hydrolase
MRRRILVLILTGLFASAAQAQTSAHVGLATRVFHPAQTRNWRGAEHKELRCTIWYPAISTAVETRQTIGPPDAPLFEAGSAAPDAQFEPSLRKFPLVLLSHGSGGSAAQMAWLGTALARAGYIAVAVDHPGNNSREPYTAEGFVLWWERATDMSEVLDGVLADAEIGPHIDPDRVGSAGFSIGGYTAMALAGAETDVSIVYDLCRATPNSGQKPDKSVKDTDTAVCHTPEMRNMGDPQQMLQAVRKTSGESLARSADSFRDPRVKAVFAIAPAMAMTFTDDSLRAIRLPVEMVVGKADPIAPARDNDEWIRMNVRGARETILSGGVMHYTFLDTCTPEGRSKLETYCTDNTGVNRDTVHAQVAEMAVKFFDRALRAR